MTNNRTYVRQHDERCKWTANSIVSLKRKTTSVTLTRPPCFVRKPSFELIYGKSDSTIISCYFQHCNIQQGDYKPSRYLYSITDMYGSHVRFKKSKKHQFMSFCFYSRKKSCQGGGFSQTHCYITQSSKQKYRKPFEKDDNAIKVRLN